MQSNIPVKIKTRHGLGDLLVSQMRGTEELGRLFQYQLVMRSADHAIEIDAVLGHNATVALARPDGSTRYFNGFITRFSYVEGTEGDHAVYEATMSPWLWFLTRTSDCRIFQEKTVPDIVKEVFNDNGFGEFEDRLSRSYPLREYCVQYRESDFNFISRLLEQEGIYYYFTHHEGRHQLVLADGYGSHNPIGGASRLPYQPRGTRQTGTGESVSSWHIDREIQSGKYAHTDYDFKTPGNSLLVERAIQRNHPYADGDVFDYPGEFDNTDDGDQYALARLEALQTGFERVSGMTDARTMTHGSLFTLRGHPREDQNREYLVVRCSYQLNAGESGSDERRPQPVYSCEFTAIESKTVFRAARTTSQPIVQGPQTAVVVGPAGEEIYPDEYGRVKVQFHWDRYGESAQQSSCWIRVAQAWAGSGWGIVCIPRIGEEVIVDFLEGDPDRPIITGRVYNAANMPPYELPDNKTQSGIRSRSTKGGGTENFNEIRMDDKMGSEELYVQAERDYSQLVKNNRSETIGNDRALDVGHDKSETVGNSKTVQVGVDQTVSIGSNLTETVGRNYSMNVGAAMELTVGGAMVETAGASRTEAVGANKRVNVGNNAATRVGKSVAEQVGKNKSVQVGNNESVKVGKRLLLDAGDQITIKTGKASITMKKDGTIAIRGKDISVSGSGAINLKASKNLVLKGKKIVES